LEVAKEPLDVLAVGETLVDFISVEQTDWLRNATTFRRYLGGSPANIAVNVARLGGRSAVVSKTGIGAFAQFVKSELQRHGVSIEYLVMDHRNRTTVAFVSSTSGKPDFEIARSGDYRLRPEEIPAEAVERAKIVHASAFALSREPCRSAVGKVFQMAREQGKIVSLDPNYSARIWPHHKEARQILREIYQYVNITKPSTDDASGRSTPPSSTSSCFTRWDRRPSSSR
jgi:fructokinase